MSELSAHLDRTDIQAYLPLVAPLRRRPRRSRRWTPQLRRQGEFGRVLPILPQWIRVISPPSRINAIWTGEGRLKVFTSAY